MPVLYIVLCIFISATFVSATPNTDTLSIEEIYEKAFKKKLKIEHFLIPVNVSIDYRSDSTVMAYVPSMGDSVSIQSEPLYAKLRENIPEKHLSLIDTLKESSKGSEFLSSDILKKHGFRHEYNRAEKRIVVYLPLRVHEYQRVYLSSRKSPSIHIKGALSPSEVSAYTNIFIENNDKAHNHYTDLDLEHALNIVGVSIEAVSYVGTGDHLKYPAYSRFQRISKHYAPLSATAMYGQLLGGSSEYFSFTGYYGTGVSNQVFNKDVDWSSTPFSYKVEIGRIADVFFYNNGDLVKKFGLVPGKYVLSNLPQQSGENRYKMVVKERAGKTRTYRFYRYSSSEILGKNKFKYNFGYGSRDTFINGQRYLNDSDNTLLVSGEYGVLSRLSLSSSMMKSKQDFMKSAGFRLGFGPALIFLDAAQMESTYNLGESLRSRSSFTTSVKGRLEKRLYYTVLNNWSLKAKYQGVNFHKMKQVGYTNTNKLSVSSSVSMVHFDETYPLQSNISYSLSKQRSVSDLEAESNRHSLSWGLSHFGGFHSQTLISTYSRLLGKESFNAAYKYENSFYAGFRYGGGLSKNEYSSVISAHFTWDFIESWQLGLSSSYSVESKSRNVSFMFRWLPKESKSRLALTHKTSNDATRLNYSYGKSTIANRDPVSASLYANQTSGYRSLGGNLNIANVASVGGSYSPTDLDKQAYINISRAKETPYGKYSVKRRFSKHGAQSESTGSFRYAMGIAFADDVVGIGQPVRDGGFVIVQTKEAFRESIIPIDTGGSFGKYNGLVTNFSSYSDSSFNLQSAQLPIGLSIKQTHYSLNTEYKRGFVAILEETGPFFVYGKIRDQHGRAFSYNEIRITSAEDPSRSYLGLTGSTGKFQLDGLFSGRYTIEILGKDNSESELSFTIEETDTYYLSLGDLSFNEPDSKHNDKGDDDD